MSDQNAGIAPYQLKKLKTGSLERMATTFGAVLAANLLAGLILLLCVRAYLKWSVQEGIDEIKAKATQKR
jgi:hypothetical protein